MSERVFGVIIIAALVIGFCRLVWCGLNWLTAWRARRAAVRRRLGMAPWRGKRRILGPGPGAACGDDAVDDGVTIPDLPRGRSIPNVIARPRSS